MKLKVLKITILKIEAGLKVRHLKMKVSVVLFNFNNDLKLLIAILPSFFRLTREI